MFKNKADDGKLNISGQAIAKLRIERKLSQRALADALQDEHIDLNKNTIQLIESGNRFVTDIELSAFARFFHCSCDALLHN